jgi:hypothetical protein
MNINPAYMADAAYVASRAVEYIVNVRGDADPGTGKRPVVAIRSPEEIAVILAMVRIALEATRPDDCNPLKTILAVMAKDHDFAKKVADTVTRARKGTGNGKEANR